MISKNNNSRTVLISFCILFVIIAAAMVPIWMLGEIPAQPKLLDDDQAEYIKSEIMTTPSLGAPLSFDGFSSDVELPLQYITAYENSRLLQQVEYTDFGGDGLDLKIDSFTVKNTQYCPDNAIYTVEVWADGGNGYYDGGGSPPRQDDTLVERRYPSNFMSGVSFGHDDDSPCFVVGDGESRMLFVLVDLKNYCTYNNYEIQTEIDASDLISSGTSNWAKYQSTTTATNPVELFCLTYPSSIEIFDTDFDGVMNEIVFNLTYPIGPVAQMWHYHNEAQTIDHFYVNCRGEQITIESIDFVTSNTENAEFKLVLDQSDPDLVVETSSDRFSVSFDDFDESLMFRDFEGRSVPLAEVMPYYSITDGAPPLVTSLSVSDDLLLDEDINSSFVVSVEFSEGMNTSNYPVFDFSEDVDSGSSPTIVFDSGYWSDEKTYHANYSVVDVDASFLEVEVTCTQEGCYDVSGLQLYSSYTTEALFDVEMKPPEISNWPSDNLTVGSDYTVRITVEDDSVISSVVLDYDFGSGLNTKPMSFDPSTEKYVAVLTPPLDATNLSYRVSAVDMYDNTQISSFHVLSVGNVDDDETEEPDDNETQDPTDNQTSDPTDDDSGETDDGSGGDDGSDEGDGSSEQTNETDDQISDEQTPGFGVGMLLCALCIVIVGFFRKKK